MEFFKFFKYVKYVSWTQIAFKCMHQVQVKTTSLEHFLYLLFSNKSDVGEINENQVFFLPFEFVTFKYSRIH